MTAPSLVAETSVLPPQLELPVIAMRGIVPFPGMVLPLPIGRSKSLAALQAAEEDALKLVALIPQKNPDVQDPTQDDLLLLGAVARLTAAPETRKDGRLAQVEVLRRVVVVEWLEIPGMFRARLELVPLPHPPAAEANKAALDGLVRELIAISPDLDPVLVASLRQAQNLELLTDLLAGVLQHEGSLGYPEALELLGMPDTRERAARISGRLREEISFQRLRDRIEDEVKTEMEERQKEYYLRKQLKIIQGLLSDSQAQAEWGVEAAERRSRKSFLRKQAKAIVDELREMGSDDVPAEEARWVATEEEDWQSEAIERDQMNVIGSAVTREVERLEQIYRLEKEKELLERWLTRLEESPDLVAGLDLGSSFLEARLRHQRSSTVQQISELERSRRRGDSG